MSRVLTMLSAINFTLVVSSTSKEVALKAVNMMRDYMAGQPVERRLEYHREGAEKLPVKAEAASVEIVEKCEEAANVATEAEQCLLDRIAEETKAWGEM